MRNTTNRMRGFGFMGVWMVCLVLVLVVFYILFQLIPDEQSNHPSKTNSELESLVLSKCTTTLHSTMEAVIVYECNRSLLHKYVVYASSGGIDYGNTSKKVGGQSKTIHIQKEYGTLQPGDIFQCSEETAQLLLKLGVGSEIDEKPNRWEDETTSFIGMK